MSKSYNGWLNRETWLVVLWLDNDQATYNEVRNQAQYEYDSAEPTQYLSKKERALHSLAQWLQNKLEQENPLANKANVYTDLLNDAISEVAWEEIADHYLEEYK